jgi:retron-type reverse transcriptase
MQPLHDIWPKMIAFENLWLAWRKARRGKSRSGGAVAFELDLERNLLDLQRELKDGDYHTGAYRLFTIYERKPRLIAAAPFRDRVVHHALMNIIEPPLDRHFIFDSYACRRGKGVHAAVNRYQLWAQRYTYAMKLDVRRYFPSIDHANLKDMLCLRIDDAEVLNLLNQIVDCGPKIQPENLVYFPGDNLFTPLERPCGIPIGNLTSQFFANVYLDGFDHRIKEELGVRAYLRYVDDMVLLADSKVSLYAWRDWVVERLGDLRLRIHSDKAKVCQVNEGLELLGYRIFPRSRRLRNENGLRFRRRLRSFAKGYAKGQLNWPEINSSVQAWIGHACHADTLSLRRKLFSSIRFQRERTK